MHLKTPPLALVIITIYTTYVNASNTIIKSRLVVTFHTRELAAQDYVVPNTTVVRQYGRRLILDFGREVDLEIDSQAIFNNINQKLIENIEIDDIAHSSFQWPVLDSETYSIKPQQAWQKTLGNSDVVVAVIDSGLQTSGPNNFKNYKAGYDFQSYDSNPLDDGYAGCSENHGTYVANIIAFNHDLGLGYYGVAPNCSIQILRALNSCGSGYAVDVSTAITYAAGGYIDGIGYNPTPAKIISISLNGKASCPSYFQSSVTFAVNMGVIVVSSAGNKNEDASLYWPSNCVGVVAVAASTRGGSRASYSNYGSRINVAAPGGDDSNQFPLVKMSGSVYYLYYGAGTSFAAPMVSGIFALWISWLRQLKVSDSKLVNSIPYNSITANCAQCGAGIINTYITFSQSTYLARSSMVTIYDNTSKVLGQMGQYCWLQGCFTLSDCCWSCVSSCALSNKEFSYHDCKVGKNGYSLCSSVCETTMCASEKYYTQCTMGTSKILSATCASCTACSSGYYRSSGCYDMANSQCSPCTLTTQAGTYKKDCWGTNPGYVANCSNVQ